MNAASSATDPYPNLSAGMEIPGTRIWSTTETSWGDFYENTVNSLKQGYVGDSWKCPTVQTPNGDPYGGDSNGQDPVTGKWFRVCIKNPWKEPRDPVQWANYEKLKIDLLASAFSESQAWNAANPGKQKCIQWGPLIDPDGGVSSGGVCANPVAPGAGTTVTTQESEAIVGPTLPVTPTTVAPVPVPIANEYSRYGNGAPFTIVLPGQLSTSQCPTGYQGANGVIVAIGTGTFTECWPTAAWEANRIGGNVWEQFKASGGTYDVMAEVTRRANVASLKSQAKSVAQTAADKTPGIQRCSKWTGYGETGEECAYTFIQPTGSTSSGTGNTAIVIPPVVSDTSTAITVPSAIQNSDTSTATTLASNPLTTSTSSVLSSTDSSKVTSVEEVKLDVTGTPKEIVSLISKVSTSTSEAKTLTSLINKLATALSKISTKSVKLPYSVSADESAKTLTPEVCTVKGVTVTSLKKGSCIIEYTVSGESGNQFTTSKTFEFKK
jgi:hypothetical protein